MENSINFFFLKNVPRFSRLKSIVSHFQKRLWASYQLNYTQTGLETGLLMVSKFKFVPYGNIEETKIALYVPRFNSDGCLKSKVYHFKNQRFLNFQNNLQEITFEPKRILPIVEKST